MPQPASLLYDPNVPAPHLDCDTFSRVQVFHQPTGGTTIGWELKPNLKLPCEPHFYVDFGRSGTNEWEPVSETPVIGGCIEMDTQQRYWDNLADYYYRVRMLLPCVTDPDTGQCQVIVSQPQQANGVWSKRDWLLAREIARKEYLLQRKRTNITAVGFILKRRRYGIPCNKCRDYDTTEIINTNCDDCFGTGFIGGYFPAVDFTFTLNAPWKRGWDPDAKLSRRNDVARQGRAVAYPYLDTDDVFVRKDSGERFLVRNVQTVAEVGGIPVVVIAELRLAPVTDIIYRIPLEGAAVSSSAAPADLCGVSSSSEESSSEEPAFCDYRVGVSEEEDW